MAERVCSAFREKLLLYTSEGALLNHYFDLCTPLNLMQHYFSHSCSRNVWWVGTTQCQFGEARCIAMTRRWREKGLAGPSRVHSRGP